VCVCVCVRVCVCACVCERGRWGDMWSVFWSVFCVIASAFGRLARTVLARHRGERSFLPLITSRGFVSTWCRDRRSGTWCWRSGHMPPMDPGSNNRFAGRRQLTLGVERNQTNGGKTITQQVWSRAEPMDPGHVSGLCGKPAPTASHPWSVTMTTMITFDPASPFVLLGSSLLGSGIWACFALFPSILACGGLAATCLRPRGVRCGHGNGAKQILTISSGRVSIQPVTGRRVRARQAGAGEEYWPTLVGILANFSRNIGQL
jgi:hypothetical protein